MANEVVKQQQTLQQLMNSGAVVKKMNDVLGSEKKASSFISSVISVSQNNKLLRNAEPMSILSSAMVAATLDLPVVPTLGMAYLVPYKGVCSFQIGYKGILELAMRSGEFRNIIDEVVYDGQLVKKNKFTGEYVFDEDSIKLDNKGQANQWVLWHGLTSSTVTQRLSIGRLKKLKLMPSVSHRHIVVGTTALGNPIFGKWLRRRC